MSEKVKGFTVTLESDIREEEFENIKKAFSMIKGVVNIEPSTSDINDHMNRERVKYEFQNKFYNFIRKEF